MSGPWKTHIKPRLLELRSRRRLKEDYFQHKDIFCKCGSQIVQDAKILSHYREVEIKDTNGHNHVTACCQTCADKIREDVQLANDYYVLDLVQWQNEADQIPVGTELADRVSNLLTFCAPRVFDVTG